MFSRMLRDGFYYCIFIGCGALLVWQAVEASRNAEMRAKAEQQTQLWKTMIQNVDIALIVVDADTSAIATWNAGAEKIFGWKSEDVIGRPLSIILPEDYVASHAERLRSPAVQRRLSTEILRLHCAAKSATGEIPISVSITGIDSPDRYRFLLTIARDEQVREVPKTAMPLNPQPATLNEDQPRVPWQQLRVRTDGSAR